jgi:hypothetical protein
MNLKASANALEMPIRKVTINIVYIDSKDDLPKTSYEFEHI